MGFFILPCNILQFGEFNIQKGGRGLELDEIYIKYADTVYRYLLSMCADPSLAEELTQETFFRAVKNIRRFDGSVKVTTWLCTIAKNAYFSRLKKDKRRADGDISDMDIPDSSDPLDRESCRLIYRAVHSLGEPYSEIILLRSHTDMSFAEIADIFGRTENWARVTFYRGKEKLRKILDEQEEIK